jgi:hypothetical protein
MLADSRFNDFEGGRYRGLLAEVLLYQYSNCLFQVFHLSKQLNYFNWCSHSIQGFNDLNKRPFQWRLFFVGSSVLFNDIIR